MVMLFKDKLTDAEMKMIERFMLRMKHAETMEDYEDFKHCIDLIFRGALARIKKETLA